MLGSHPDLPIPGRSLPGPLPPGPPHFFPGLALLGLTSPTRTPPCPHVPCPPPLPRPPLPGPPTTWTALQKPLGPFHRDPPARLPSDASLEDTKNLAKVGPGQTWLGQSWFARQRASKSGATGSLLSSTVARAHCHHSVPGSGAERDFCSLLQAVAFGHQFQLLLNICFLHQKKRKKKIQSQVDDAKRNLFAFSSR